MSPAVPNTRVCGHFGALQEQFHFEVLREQFHDLDLHLTWSYFLYRAGSCSASQQKARYSITSSASASSLSGIWRPSAFAVLRLMLNSIFVACITGKSAGFSPLRMRPA